MSIIDQKKDIYGQIAALRVSCEGFPEFKLNSSLPSISNCTDSMEFLIDLLKSTIGFEPLKGILSNIITYELSNIETQVKKALKNELKGLVSCGVNPSIPDFFLHQSINPTATGVNLNLKKVDYLGVMLVDPSSTEGALLYDDINGGVNSTDYHTYLFNTIQLDGPQTDWGSQTLGSPNDVLTINFNSYGPPNNIVNVKASAYYSDPVNNKKLTDINNDYIDSINLFGSGTMLNNLIDSLFGTISFSLGKTKEEIKKEIEIENIIECIINSDDGDGELIDDSFFTFSNETVLAQEEDSTARANGVRVLKNCDNVLSEVNLDTLTAQTQTINSVSTLQDLSTAITSALDAMSTDMADNVSDKNKVTAKLSFIDGAIKKLMVMLGKTILSPKVITIFAVNHYIIYGTDLDNPIDWMKKNKILMKSVLKAIRNVIIGILLEEVLKSLKDLIACNAQKLAIDYAKAQSTQIASLVGIPPEILRIIRGI